MKIGICGNIQSEHLANELDKKLENCEIVLGDRKKFRDELTRPFGEFLALDLCIVALDWREIDSDIYGAGYSDDHKVLLAGFRNKCEEVKKSLEDFRSSQSAPLLVYSPLSNARQPTGFIDRILERSYFNLFIECQHIFNKMCQSVTDVYPIDIDLLSSRIGLDNAFDHRTWYVEDQPFSQLMISTIVQNITIIINQIKRYPAKCLVLDLDNTLWGGVVGEVGMDGIVLGDSGVGRAFKNFQTEIVKLYKQGVILTVSSKNNTCDALDVLEKHPHCMIRPSMISSFRINWDDKPKSVLNISQELKIGLDSMMFVDDSRSERAMMKTSLPQVTILDMPEDPSLFVNTLQNCSRFYPLHITTDDVVKTTYLKGEYTRAIDRELASNIEDFLLKSEITIKIGQADEATLPRITQLFNKTNQFNLTTIRYNQSDLSALAKAPGNCLYYMEMRDKYGEYGIVGSTLVIQNRIDSFLISCRAFGKSVERALLAYVIERLGNEGFKKIVGDFSSTEKNSMAKNFYFSCGFTLLEQRNEKSKWEFATDSRLEKPRWVTIKSEL